MYLYRSFVMFRTACIPSPGFPLDTSSDLVVENLQVLLFLVILIHSGCGETQSKYQQLEMVFVVLRNLSYMQFSIQAVPGTKGRVAQLITFDTLL